MSRFTLLAAAILCASFAFAADDENPWKNSKVGDWVEYKSSTENPALPTKMESTSKQTVTAKTDKEVTIKTEMNMMGNKQESEQKIDLTKKYDPASAASMPGMKMTVEKGKEGDETITVAGKSYKTHWSESKSFVTMGEMKIETEAKSWVSKDVPCGGMVKSEMKQSIGTKISMELVGSGMGK